MEQKILLHNSDRMTKKELERRHGTPEEFAEAVWQAYDHQVVTSQEARDAVFEYWQEWEKAE